MLPTPGKIFEDTRSWLLPAIAFLLCSPGPALTNQKDGGDSFVVGIKQTPPFTILEPDGSWSGPTVWLVENIVDELGKEVVYHETDLEDIFTGVDRGEFDAGAAALSITAQREEIIDFTPPFFTSGIGIATRADEREMWELAFRNIFSWRFLQVFLGLLLLLAAVGLLVWLAERKVNRSEFGGRPAEGIGNGLWYSAVTMTTVGYGDKTPKTLPGRAIGLIWMFLATLIISGFTAGFASSLTRDSITGRVEGPGDLSKVKTATVAGSTSALWLDQLKIPFSTGSSVESLLDNLENGDLGAVVFDKPVLEYYAGKGALQHVQVLEPVYSRENYAIALPQNSPYRERFNVLLLQLTETDQWTSELLKVLRKNGD